MAENIPRDSILNKNMPVPTQGIVGKVPPQALDLEEAVLGAMMLEKEQAVKVLDILDEDYFYSSANQAIFAAIKSIFEAGAAPIDILTVTEELRKMGMLDVVGGAYYISQLTNRVASTAHSEYHAHIITQKFIQRKLISVCDEIKAKAFDEKTDALGLLDEAEREMYEIKNKSLKRSYDSISDLLNKAINQIEDNKGNDDGLTGVGSGFIDLDRITAGWQKSDLIILAARPGMGKTAFALSLLRNAAIQFEKPVAIFSLEMSSVQLVTRLISAETGLSGDKLKKGQLEEHEWHQLNSKISGLSKAKIFIDDTAGIPIFDFRAKCRRLKSQFDIQMVIVDYLQLITTDDKAHGNREQQISHISKSLKMLAKELEIPVIALSQLSREVEKRPDKRPMLSDLRESGSIEQDADIVSFIYRPEYYKVVEGENGEDLRGVAEIIIAKHRNGETDTARLKWIGHLAKFDNLSHSDYDLGVDEGNQFLTLGSKMNELGGGDNSFPSMDMPLLDPPDEGDPF